MKITKLTIWKILKLNVAKSNLLRFLKNHYARVYKKILEQTKFLDCYGTTPHPISIFERLYCIEHDLHERPFCQNCQKEHVCGFNVKLYEYKKWCSTSCQASDESCIAKSKATRKELYCNENYNGVEKSRETRMENNGGKWHAEDFGDKCKQTKVKNWHDPNWNNAEKTKETIANLVNENPNFWLDREQKTKATKVKNGHDPNWNNREKYHESCLERYGVYSYPMSQDFKLKTKETISQIPDFYEKRDIKTKETISQIPDFYEKRDIKTRKTNMKNLGVEYYLQTDECKELRKERQTELNYLTLQQSEYDSPVFSALELFVFSDDHTHEFEFECKECHDHFFSLLFGTNHGRCKKCFPKPRSKYEEEILSFCKSFYLSEIIHGKNGRKTIYPYELDLYFPAAKVAIEFDGLYWHSDAETKNENYHLAKTEMCEAKGIQLLHIFENEWVNQKDIVKSTIKRLLQCSDKVLQSSDCEIKEVSSESAKRFLAENDIKGVIRAPINIGLFFNDELIAIMSVGKPRYVSNKYQYQIFRLCQKNNCSVVGYERKLLKFFESVYKPKNIVVYVDRRYSNGKIYHQLEFSLIRATKPNYWYFLHNSLKLEHRSKYQKKNLKEILGVYDPTKTEFENMAANNFRKIFDCGNLVFVKNYFFTSSVTDAD